MRFLRTAILGIAGAWLAVILWHGVSSNLGIVDIHASVHPAISGKTVLHIPPLGSASATTHIGPTRIDLSIDQVHIQQTAEWLKQNKSPQDTADLVGNGIEKVALELARMAVVIAALGALFVCIIFRIGLKHTILGCIIGTLGVAIPLALTAYTYNTSAFEHASFSGEMARGPVFFNMAQQAWENNSGIVRDIPRIADRTVNLCQQLQNTEYNRLKDSRNYSHVLLISDLHNNPIAIKYALDIAQTYNVKLVLITGDFTDLGHPLEAELLAGLEKFDVPVVAVAGNHDSRATVRVLNAIPGVTMLDNGAAVRKAELSIMGFSDPASRRANIGSADTTSREIRAQSRYIVRRMSRSRMPDILMVHNNLIGRNAAGRAPVIVDGHLHDAYITNYRGSIIINPGTTGAAGIRYFSDRKAPAYTAAVLHFTPGSHTRIKSVDSIRMELPSGDFTVIRKSVHAGVEKH